MKHRDNFSFRMKHSYNTAVFSYLHTSLWWARHSPLDVYRPRQYDSITFLPILSCIFLSFVLHKPALTKQPGVILGQGNRITMCHAINSAASVAFCFPPSVSLRFLQHIPVSPYFPFFRVGVLVTFLDAY
jgi:hypothetical protein